MAVSLSYAAEIAGPAGVSTVPIDISYSYSLATPTDASANPYGNPSAASAYFGYAGVSNTYFVLANTNDSNAVDSGGLRTVSVSGVYQTTAPVNVALRLGLSAGANGAGGSAFLDPAISIDPSFFVSNPQYSALDFSIIDSSGVGNGLVADLPEPGAAPLFLVCLAATGLVRWRVPGKSTG